MTRQIKVISIDGGGIRGIIPAMVLAEIESRTGRPIAELFDLIAGTSTGASSHWRLANQTLVADRNIPVSAMGDG